jgi:hypothetical protein
LPALSYRQQNELAHFESFFRGGGDGARHRT